MNNNIILCDMEHYRIRSTKETLEKIFANHLDHVCFGLDTKNTSESGICDVVAIPGSDAVEKILKDHFILNRIEYDNLDYNEDPPDYYGFETLGNIELL